LETIIPRQKIKVLKYEKILESLKSAVGSLSKGKHTFLIRGESGVGKSVLAAECALANDCSFIKLINADRFLGLN
jgi:transcriptional regulator with PAS, ATPase and Fis domain